MNTTDKMISARKTLDGIISRCHDDESFKNKLMATPVAAIEEFTGSEYHLPEGKKFKVTDQSDPQYIYINIPRKLEVDDMELSDEELEQVAGGEFWGSVAAGVVACVIWEVGNGIIDGVRGTENDEG